MPLVRLAVLAAGAALAVVGIKKVKQSRAAKGADGSLTGDSVDLTQPIDSDPEPAY